MAVREQSEVTDADQPSWKYMNEEAAEEVRRRDERELRTTRYDDLLELVSLKGREGVTSSRRVDHVHCHRPKF
jgi:hypothetical protein